MENVLQICGVGTAKSKRMTHYQDFLSILSSNPKIDVEASVVAGQTCKETPVGNIKVSFMYIKI